MFTMHITHDCKYSLFIMCVLILLAGNIDPNTLQHNLYPFYINFTAAILKYILKFSLKNVLSRLINNKKIYLHLSHKFSVTICIHTCKCLLL